MILLVIVQVGDMWELKKVEHSLTLNIWIDDPGIFNVGDFRELVKKEHP